MEQVTTALRPGGIEQNKKPERTVNILTIEGIPVEFPFEPYECQRNYMAQVIRALRTGNNALLESPTGTGKTLCLLCATLAWRESLRGYRPDMAAATAAAAGSAGGASMTEQLLGVKPDASLSGLHPALQLIATAAAGGGGAGASGSTLLAGPSGGGGGGGGGPELPVVVYSSRTHSQLAQVVKELKNSSYRDRVRSTVMASRQQTCLHPQVSKMPAGQINQGCKSITAHKKCPWNNNLKYGRNKDWTAKVDNIPDIEELVNVGRTNQLCPFYMSRDLSKEADVIFMPYNYLLDANTRKTLVDQVRWDNAVIIFDEAHNVEGVSSDASSFDITAKQLTDAMQETKRCKEVCLEQMERGNNNYYEAGAAQQGGNTADKNVNYRQLYQDLELLQKILKMVENGLHGLSDKIPQDGLTRPGAFLFDFLREFRITSDTLPVLNTTIDVATEVLQDYEIEMGHTSNNKNVTAALQHLQSCLNLAFCTLDPISMRKDAPPAHKGYRVHIHMEKSWGADKLPAPTLSFWCFIPGMAFRMLKALNMRSILLTSGTLSPLETFAHELQLPFEVRLENPHIIKPSQVWVGVLSTGPSGHTLCSNYQSRDDTRYKDDLGNAIVNFARLVPDGLLVFFPSYTVLDKCIEHWKGNGGGSSPSAWERMIKHKAPVIEPRDSSLFQQSIEDYKAKLNDPSTNGAVFFAVCRGKVSEGLDFSDKAGRGVVITGIPYALRNDPKVRLKREVLDEEQRLGSAGIMGGGISGEQWYVQQAMRAVNQAMGRVIRHRWDYGAVILADKRFAEPTVQRQMSKWLQEHVVHHPNFGSTSSSLTKFFKEKASFQPPADYAGKAQRAETVTPFQMVGAAGGNGAAAGGRSGLNGPGGGRSRSIYDSIPAAMDVSGLAGITGSTAAALAASRQKQQQQQRKAPGAAGPSSSGTVTDAGVGSLPGGPASQQHQQQSSQQAGGAAGASGSGSGGLMGMLQQHQQQQVAAGSHPAAATDAAAAAGGTDESAGGKLESMLGQGSSRTAALLERSGSSAAAAGSSRPPLATAGSGSSSGLFGRQQGLPRAHITPAYEACGTGAGGTSGSTTAVNVVGPMNKVLEHRAKAAAAAAGGAGADVASGSGRDAGIEQIAESNGTFAASRSLPQAAATRAPIAPVARASISAKAPPAPQPPQAGGSDAAGGAPAAAGGSKRLTPAEFMASLKQQLDKAVFKQVQELLAQYKTAKNAQEFIEGVVQLLKGPTTVHLLMGFKDFVPKADQTWFTEVVRTHVTAQQQTQAPNLISPASRLKVPAGTNATQRLQQKVAEVALQQAEQQHAQRHQAAAQQRQQQQVQQAQPQGNRLLQQAVLPGARPAAGAAAGSAASGARITSAVGIKGAGGLQQQVQQVAKAPPPQLLPAKRPLSSSNGSAGLAPVAAAPGAGPGATGVSQGGAACSMCGKAPMDQPFASPCGHMGCHTCWVSQLAQHFACPVCKRQIKSRSQLTKKFFV